MSTTNIKQVAGTKAEELIANLLVEASNAKANYSKGKKFWAMNEATYTLLQSKLIAFNSNAALVSAINNTMPILTGDIVTLPFLAEGDIIGGYGDLYVLAERSGMSLASSDQVQFIEDTAENQQSLKDSLHLTSQEKHQLQQCNLLKTKQTLGKLLKHNED